MAVEPEIPRDGQDSIRNPLTGRYQANRTTLTVEPDLLRDGQNSVDVLFTSRLR